MGLFFIEGARLCGDALDEWRKGKLELAAVFASENALFKYKDYINPEYFEDDRSGIFYTVDDNICKKISDTKANQGVFAIVKSKDNSLNIDDIDSDGKYLILNNLQDPGNLGTLLRTADAVGISGVILSNNCCDIYNPKVLRSAMGSIFRVKVYVENDFSKGSAVVIGNEGNGLSNDDAMLCDERVTIKMHGNINSLNAAMAGGIILWEMKRNGVGNE